MSKEKTLKLSNTTARKLYPSAAPEFKKVLEETFGKEFFSQDITERIFNFEQVCEEAGKNPLDYQILPGMDSEERGKILFSMLQLICTVFKQGVKLDYKNPNQEKHYTWFNYAGSGFSLHDACYVLTHSVVGARLSVDTQKKARHIGTYFIDIYNAYLQEA